VTNQQTEGTNKPLISGYLNGLFALLTCPCHIPIYAMLLSGTAVGSLLAANQTIAFGLFFVLFLFFVFTIMRLLKSKQVNA